MEPIIIGAPQTLVAVTAPAASADCAADFVSWGVPFRLAAESPSLLDQMRRLVPFGSVPVVGPISPGRTFGVRGSRSRSEFQLHGNEELLAEAESAEKILDQLGAHLILHVGEHAPDYVFVHAGVVAWRERGLLLPGVSCAGKSTLVAELVRAGATYYSDEFGLIDRAGLVHPFPRDLRMRRPGRPEQMPVPIEQLNGHAGTLPVPVALVIFTQFEANARWSPEPLSPGRAALELLLHTLPVQRTPARVLATFSAMMHRAWAWRSPRGDAAETACALLSALETQGASA
jgi:hypothetical protein